MKEPQGFTIKREGSKLLIEIDMSRDIGMSKKGKSVLFASTGGFHKLNDQGLWIAMTVGQSTSRKGEK